MFAKDNLHNENICFIQVAKMNQPCGTGSEAAARDTSIRYGAASSSS